MRTLDDIIAEIEKEMDERDAVRELAVKSSRSVSRLASAAIRGMHRNEDVSETLRSAKEEASRLKSVLADHPELFHSGLVENALQEVTEAAVLHAVLRDEPLPSPKELNVTGAAYLLGLADAIGELRRLVLDALRAGRVDPAHAFLRKMEEFYDALIRLDYPSALVAIRRKQDIARSLIERTRGELAVASKQIELGRKMDALEKKL